MLKVYKYIAHAISIFVFMIWKIIFNLGKILEGGWGRLVKNDVIKGGGGWWKLTDDDGGGKDLTTRILEDVIY